MKTVVKLILLGLVVFSFTIWLDWKLDLGVYPQKTEVRNSGI